MDKNFSSDRPISGQKEDKFQRYDFAKRIANAIVERENDDCIVIGVYGAWGEGKTSVINFIETELKGKENILCIKFNPWRYNDENSLLTQFFQKLATTLNANLKKDKEKLGDFFKKYGKLLSIDVPLIGNMGEKVEAAGEILAEVDIEILKERIGAILKENKSKVVVFIDDIDRLDKNEIHSVFRLVKLTADFTNTTYLLSFDEEMVAAAIGERFGEGNQKSGQNFLEKIIQVPLKIPVAQPEALKKFCFELLDNAIESNKVKLNDSEKQRFVREFTSNILPKLDTPRLAVRYGNTLSFSLPLLNGEVNLVDLMLIEAIKIFYPNHYEFIKLNPEFFIGSYSDRFSQGKDNDKVNSIKEHFELLGNGLTKKHKSCILNLMKELFPRLNEVFHNRVHYTGNYDDWFKKKRIVSPKYFNRFFSFAVIDGEVSDVAFENFLSEITSMTVEQVAEALKILVEQSSPENFIYKIRIIEEDINWEASIKIAKAISISSEIFPIKKGFSLSFGYGAPQGQAAIFIYQLINKHENREERFDLAKELMSYAQPFEFAYELNKWFRSGDTPEQKVFTSEQYVELATLLIQRSLKESNGQPLFEKYSDFQIIKFILGSWSESDHDEMNKYIRNIIEKDKSKVIDLLRAFTPTGVNNVVGEYRADFTKDIYDYFITLFGKEFIKETILKAYSKEVVNEKQVIWINMGTTKQTDINIIRQFLHLYESEKLTNP